MGLVVVVWVGGCVGSDECTVERALLDSGDVILLCGSDPETPEAMRARLVGETGYVVVAEPRGEASGSGAPIVAPDPSGHYLTKLTEHRTYQVVDPLGSELTGEIDVLAWSGDAHLSDEYAAPICLEPSPGRPQLFQCDAFGQTHPDDGFRQIVLFLVNDPAGLVLYRWGRIGGTEPMVTAPGGSVPLESLRL